MGARTNDLVDVLIAHPGQYVGRQEDPTDQTDRPLSVARIMVTALPGGSGVTMDYEVLSADHGVVHAERAVLARTTGGLVLITAHTHSEVTTVLRETEPGFFPSAAGDSPFPMAIRLEVPEPGRLLYYWSHAMPGDEPVVRDIGTVTLVQAEPTARQ